MTLEKMQAKIGIAKSLRLQSEKVWAFRVEHFSTLSDEKRLSLADASNKLAARADEVLQDALEEGTEGAERLLGKLADFTAEIEACSASVANVSKILGVAAAIAKAAAGVVSGGVGYALQILAAGEE